MLSYKTILAVQVLAILNREEGCKYSITELKAKSGLQYTEVGRVVRQLIKYGWLTSNSKNKHSITEYMRTRTLYDLVLITDGGVIMGFNVDQAYLPFWGETAKKSIPHAIRFNEELCQRTEDMLQSITIMELITEVQKTEPCMK